MRTSILTSALFASALCAASPALAQDTIDTRIDFSWKSGDFERLD